ncbi:4-oxalocrotonate tautomerase DmpI [Desulforamulus ferrireducens]|uniref:4-oxalocrotonate tautomerase n=1 Tax=Desulforamulus ferrireducens TaxID=1833852 RepID=A0A1S6ITD2_9FIRM|nr:4-oxalocrotonate tautomerase DmpI [Desulforamulus ferrireducens]AQS58039.1 4-oxalocrotonate tautomerase [Desulforamulus ferrireducens]
MPVITVDGGKLTKEQKYDIIKTLTKDLSEITKIPAQFISIIIRENEDDNMGVAGESVTEMKQRLKK